MSKQRLASRDRSTVEVVSIDPTTGSTIGTTQQPLITQTSTLQTVPDLTLARFAISTATTTPLVAAVAATKVRVYRIRLDVAGADILTWVDNASTFQIMNFTGAGFMVLDFNTRPWFYSAAVNTAFSLTTSAAVAVNLLIEYTQVA